MNEKLKKKRKKKKNEEEKYTLAVTQFFLEFEAFEMTNQQEEIVKKQHIYIELLSFRLKKNSLSLSDNRQCHKQKGYKKKKKKKIEQLTDTFGAGGKEVVDGKSLLSTLYNV